MQALIAGSEAEGIWTLEAGMFANNAASVALHRKNGFREVGLRQRLGQLNEVWHDVRLMERRSTAVGGPGLPSKTCPDAATDLETIGKILRIR